LKELIELIIKGIVDKPDKVEINEVIGEKSSIYEVSVDSDDIGKVIGRQGRNIKVNKNHSECCCAKRITNE